ncbi:MAG: hypothetical protein V4808_05055 [Pseudomonadota bacterium]
MRALLALTLLVPRAALAQEVPEIDRGNEIVVTGILPEEEGIVVEAPPRCYGRDGDPLDTVPVPRGVGEQSVIGPEANRVVSWHEDDQPILGPTVWQRTGNAIGDYRFRVPEEADKPVCIGARISATNGFASLRRIIAADGMHGRYLHFSARVSTRNAGQVRFYMVAGDEFHRRGRGGDTSATPIMGTHGWRTVNMIIGPVPAYANHISYGFLLQGRGDAWLSDAKLELLTREEAKAVASLPLSAVGNANPR